MIQVNNIISGTIQLHLLISLC